MTQFGGSLRFVQLPAVTQLLAELGSTGRLCITHADWTGEILVRAGQIVEARLGTERGRTALEGIAVALPDGEFNFVDEPIVETDAVLVAADARVAYLDRLGAEHQRLVQLIPSLKLVPRLVEASGDASADRQVTIEAAALQLIPALMFGHPLEQVARQRGLARTLREVAVLIEGGLVKLEPAAPAPASTSTIGRPFPAAAHSAAASVSPVPAPVQPALAPVRPFSARLLAHRVAPRQRAETVTLVPAAAGQNFAPAPVSTPPPPVRIGPRTMPPAVAARLAAAREFVALPAAQVASAPARAAVPFATWRKAIVGFFLSEDQSAAEQPAVSS